MKMTTTEKFEYKLYNQDLPIRYADQQDPLLHDRQYWLVADGSGWRAALVPRGEIKVSYTPGSPMSPGMEPCYENIEDVIELLPTDAALRRAIASGELYVDSNNWYELEFYNEDVYLDVMPADTVYYTFEDALTDLKELLENRSFQRELIKAVDMKNMKSSKNNIS